MVALAHCPAGMHDQIILHGVGDVELLLKVPPEPVHRREVYLHAPALLAECPRGSGFFHHLSVRSDRHRLGRIDRIQDTQSRG